MVFLKIFFFTVVIWAATCFVTRAETADYGKYQCGYHWYCGNYGPPEAQVCQYPWKKLFCQFYRCNPLGCVPTHWKWY